MNHHHHHFHAPACHHSQIVFCQTCQVPYCTNCKQEWGSRQVWAVSWQADPWSSTTKTVTLGGSHTH